MYVVKIKTLTNFTKNHADAKDQMNAWYFLIKYVDFPNPAAIKQKFGSADILPGNCVVFNIKDIRYRIVVKIKYNTQTVFIRFIGTHADYDKIDPENI